MRIIEQFLQSKTGVEETCEDGFVITDCFAAVIDGVTNKNAVQLDFGAPGKIAMELIKEGIGELSPQLSAYNAFESINEAIYDSYCNLGLLETMKKNPSQRFTASCVIYNSVRRELWFLGDCMALANGTTYQFSKEADKLFSDLRSFLIHIELSQGTTEEQLLEHDVCREQILDFIIRQTSLQNSSYNCPFTYYVLDGISEEAPRHTVVIPIEEKTTEIVLASDGYPALYPTLEQTEAYLTYILEIDPLCYREFRSTKGLVKGNVSFDDRAYVRLAI